MMDIWSKHNNYDLDNGDWLENIAWDEDWLDRARRTVRVELNMNDPYMLFEVTKLQDALPGK
jgi:hypothetical protein